MGRGRLGRPAGRSAGAQDPQHVGRPFAGPGPRRPGCPPGTGPSGGRRRWPRSRRPAGPRSTGPGPAPERRRRGPDRRPSRVQRASSTRRGWVVGRRCPGPAGRRPGSRAPRAGRRPPPPWPAGRAGRPRARPGRASSGSGTGGVDHQVAVAPGAWPSGGRRTRPGPTSASRTTMAGPSWLLHDFTRAAGSRPADAAAGHVEVDHLAEGVHPGVGAAGAGRASTGGAGRPGQGLGQGPGHGALARAGRRSRGSPPVVGHRQPPPDRTASVLGAPGAGGTRLTPVRCGPWGRCRPTRCPA